MRIIKSLIFCILIFSSGLAISEGNKPWYQFSADGTICRILKRDLPTPWFNRLSNGYLEGLVIDPRMPDDWDQYSVERPFRGNHYSILVKNNTRLSPGQIKIQLDGKVIKGNLIIPVMDGKRHQVNVEVGHALKY